MLDTESLEQAAALFERFVEERSSVEVEQVEDHEHHGHLTAEVGRDLLASEPVLELEEPQDPSVSMGEDFAVEEDRMTEPGRTLGQLREGSGRLLQVAREKLNAPVRMVKLAADAVVLLLRPYLLRGHALEGLGGRLDRAGEHEPDGLEQRHRARLDDAALDPDRGLADVSGDEVDTLDLRHRLPKRLGDSGLHQAFAEADAHFAGDDLDHESRGLRVEPAQQLLERRRLGGPAGGANRLQRLLDLLERHVAVVGASFHCLARPAAEVRVLSAPQLQTAALA